MRRKHRLQIIGKHQLTDILAQSHSFQIKIFRQHVIADTGFQQRHRTGLFLGLRGLPQRQSQQTISLGDEEVMLGIALVSILAQPGEQLHGLPIQCGLMQIEITTLQDKLALFEGVQVGA